MRVSPRRARRLSYAATVAVLIAAWTCTPAGAADEESVIRLDRIRRLDDLSRALWPDWKISDAPVVLYDGAGQCYLLNHPDPPGAFERARTGRPYRRTYHIAETTPGDLEPESGMLAGVPTAFVSWQRFVDEAVPAVFEEAFRVHLSETCPDMASHAELLEGYPMRGENLALSDIECELLARALTAPDDSVAQRAYEFVAVRSFRMAVLGSPVVEAYERYLEFACGVPAYVAERCRREAPGRLTGRDADPLAEALGVPKNVETCLRPLDDLDWYRSDRFRWSGAAICALLDRLGSGWKKETAESCREPYDILWQLSLTEMPSALDVLAERGYYLRVQDRDAFVDGTKSDAERLFESIVGWAGESIAIDTRLLASSSVSYDPENIEKVDDHRLVHKRVLKIEYSGGTRVHVIGTPVAAFVGADEFDISRLVMEAPEAYEVLVGGERLALTPGVHHADEPLSVSGPGLIIEARSGVVLVGEKRVTFVLHR